MEELGIEIRRALIENGLPEETTIHGMGKNYYGQPGTEAALNSLNGFLRCHGYHVRVEAGRIEVTRNGRY